MEIMKLLEDINNCKEFPVNEINALMERREESFPVLLELIQSVSIDYKRIKLDRLDFIVAWYILSQWREKNAFPYLIKLASISSEWVDRVWGDAITESLVQFFVSTFDGNIQALKKLIENEAADSYCRAAALDALVGLVAQKILTREEVLSYFKTLMKSDLVYDYEFSSFIVDSAYKLYPQELYQEIADLFERDLVDTWYISKQNVEEALSNDKNEWLKTYLYEDKHHLPINNVIEAIGSWLDFESMETLENLPCISNKSKNGYNESCC